MTAHDVQLRVDVELTADPALATKHARLLARGLLPPRLIAAYSMADATQQLYEVWLVFAEVLEEVKGYAIIYDAEENLFGLAVYVMFDCVGILGYREHLLGVVDGM